LQAALNDRLSPSPKLSVDGDFGGMTEQAVVRFRRENGLEEIGLVDAAMWAKIGEIKLDKDNQERLEDLKPLEAPDEPSGMPVVSCKAWVIADAKTGELLGGNRQDEPLDIASTTKMMTALLLAQEIQSDPKLLDVRLVFSKRADETTGSSSTVRAGESILLRDAFY
jgi:D-alanyl-D-alanine carboxypeptidase (penicillin-binding protein 5/6)